MSPGSPRRTRDDYIAGMLAALDVGHFDISLNELCSTLRVTTGSFYSHFADIRKLHSAVIGIWLRDRIVALPDTPGDGILDPLESMRKIRAAASDNAVRDGAMRRWAAAADTTESAVARGGGAWVHSATAAAEAVAELDRIVLDHLTRAVTDLGFAGREPADLAGWLAAALQDEGRARDPVGFETILEVLTRAEAFAPDGPEVTSAGAAPDAIMLYAAARGLPARERQVLGEVARLLAGAHRAGDESSRPPDRAEASQA